MMRKRAVLLLGIALVSGRAVWAQALTNEGFEAGTLAGWETFGPGWRTSGFTNELGSDARSGAYGLVTDIKKGMEDEWRGISQTVPAKRGMIYSGAVWIRAMKARDVEAMLEFQFLDGEKRIVDMYQSGVVSGDEPFTQVEISGVQPPKGTEWLAVRGVVHVKQRPGGGEQFVMFDDFQLTVTSKTAKAKSGKPGPSSRIEERMAKRALARGD